MFAYLIHTSIVACSLTLGGANPAPPCCQTPTTSCSSCEGCRDGCASCCGDRCGSCCGGGGGCCAPAQSCCK